ncbi:rubrerythrin family protein [Desulfonatronovibrio hydrogenovorans]|uniref:rubrerythrin family protein n=1 Tax=Desulfonatronovibrio hydrogenovorans TaxID=53245 RepID=UPI00048C51D9|nr:rubrerythrin family protein [Desulfonatronovibrio hydrogenovorans]
MSKTFKNLEEAFAGESQANRKYLGYARQAEKEGYPRVAKLFRAVAEAETVHALTHLKHMDGIKSTRENLLEAIAGETHEFKKMYPGMIEEAAQEGKNAVKRSFEFANAVEEIHAGLYQDVLDNLDDLPDVDYHVCSVCGYTVAGEAPGKCPVCNAAQKAFFRVD